MAFPMPYAISVELKFHSWDLEELFSRHASAVLGFPVKVQIVHAAHQGAPCAVLDEDASYTEDQILSLLSRFALGREAPWPNAVRAAEILFEETLLQGLAKDQYILWTETICTEVEGRILPKADQCMVCVLVPFNFYETNLKRKLMAEQARGV